MKSKPFIKVKFFWEGDFNFLYQDSELHRDMSMKEKKWYLMFKCALLKMNRNLQLQPSFSTFSLVALKQCFLNGWRPHFGLRNWIMGSKNIGQQWQWNNDQRKNHNEEDELLFDSLFNKKQEQNHLIIN